MTTASDISRKEVLDSEKLTRINVYNADGEAGEEHLFRGAPFSLLMDRYLETDGFYYGTKPDSPVTSVSTDPGYAMIYARKGADRLSAQRDPLAEPVLLAINVSGYKTRPGLEDPSGEREVLGKIDFSDVEIVRSVDRFRELTGDKYPQLGKYFQEHFTRPLPEFSKEELLIV